MSLDTTRTVVATNTYSFPKFGKRVKCNWMRINYTSDATVGNRVITTEIFNEDGDSIWICNAGAVQAASLVRDYLWMPGIYRETSFISGGIQVPFPKDMTLEGNWVLKVYDSADISASDSMIISVQHFDADKGI